MSLPPPGLGGGAARTGPPPGFGTANNNMSGGAMTSGNSTGHSGRNDTASVTRTQLSFLISSMSEDSYDKSVTELRAVALSDGHEIYQHYVRRVAHTANPIIAALNEHFQVYKEDPAAPAPNLPTHGSPALAWRLLRQEALHAARDAQLAPLFASVVLSPLTQTALPIQSLHLLELPYNVLFTFITFTLASPKEFPPSTPSYPHLQQLLPHTLPAALEFLRSRGSPYWHQQIDNQPPYAEDITVQEAQSLMLALYPRPDPSVSSRPATPTNTLAALPSPFNSYQRGDLLNAIASRFGTAAIIYQILPALSSGGAPRSPGSIPLDDILFELGDAITSEEQAVANVMRQWWGPKLLEGGDPAQITAEMTRTVNGLVEGLNRDAQRGRNFSVDPVAQALSTASGVAWHEVVRSFDRRLPYNWSDAALMFLMRLLYFAPQDPIPPVAGLLPATADSQPWTNLATLYTILGGMLRWSPDYCPIFTISHPPSLEAFARIVDPPQSSEPETQASKDAADVQNAGIYNSMGFLRVLMVGMEQADSDHATADMGELGRLATTILQNAANFAPELVLLGLQKLETALPAPAAHVQQRLLAQYFTGYETADANSSTLVFQTLWSRDPEGLIAQLLDFYTDDEKRLERVVDIAKSLGILGKLLELDHTHLAFDVAAMAADKEEINLERWLADALDAKGDELLQSVFDFVEHKARLESEHRLLPGEVKPMKGALSPAVFSTFIRVIRNYEDLSPSDVSRFKRMRVDILILHPRLLNFLPGSKEEQGFSEKRFSVELSERTDRIYHDMYTGVSKLDDVVQQLKQLQVSSDPTDRELFASCLHSIFDEYKFIKDYPPNELIRTGILFGGIIDSRVIKDIPAFVATRYVLDACKTNPNGVMYSFGINVLSVLRRSLVDFPGLCRSLLEIPALHESHPVLINDIVAALAEREELDQQGGVKLAFPALKLPILVEEGTDEFKEPDAKKKDAIMFIVNQIAPSNYEAKSRDLANLFEDQYSRWFAHYFIDVRVALEVNRHDIYMNIVELLNSPVFEKHVLWETYRKIRDLINSDLTVSSTTERTHIKTMAAWLGRITLARNKPIRLRELSLKDLLIQGFDNKRLIVAIPFVCTLLISCSESIVFHLPNPWMVAILSLLVEFYHFAELRLNLKFEIEVLFSKLNIDLDSVSPSSLLRTHVPPPPAQEDIPDRLERELQRANAEQPGQRFEAPANDELARIQQTESDAVAREAQDLFVARVDEMISRLPEQLVFSPEYPIFTAPTSKRVVFDAIDRALKEMIQPVVERSVTIAGISTRDIVSKDFAMEGDPIKMRHAAHFMVQNLAGNLALVTCKQTLRDNMANNVRAILSQNGFTEDNMPDAMINGVVADNLDVACTVIKRAAQEKASKDIDVNLTPQYAARKAHRDSRNPNPFSDAASFGIGISQAALPDPLRLRSGGLSGLQMRVYEEFSEPTRFASSVNGDGSVGYRDGEHERIGYHQELDSRSVGHSPRPPPPMSPSMCVQRFHDIAVDIDKIVAQAPAHSISDLPHDHDLRRLIHEVVMLAGHASDRGATTIIAQKVVQLLYKSATNLGREAYTLTLQQLCETSPTVNQEVRDWLIYADDKRKLNVPVTVTLIKASMIVVAELDDQIAQNITKAPREVETIDFAAELIRDVTTGERAMYPRNAFTLTLAALLKLQEAGLATDSVNALLGNMRGPSRRASVIENGDRTVAIDEKQHNHLKHMFLEWVRVFRNDPAPEKQFYPFVTYLQKEGILSGQDVSSAFYRIAVNVAVDGDSGSVVGSEDAFVGTDSLAKFVVLLVTTTDKRGEEEVARSVYYFNKIISIISYSLIERHGELGDAFDQRPWARLYTTILSELLSIDDGEGPLYTGCLLALANAMGITQPVYAPRFAFGWMSVISHRYFLPRLLETQAAWPSFHRCLMWLLRFAEPFLRNGEFAPSSRSIYKGITRIFCMVLHDFPEFLDEHYHTLSTVIPANCLQLRNIVLTSFPPDIGPLPSPYRGLAQLQPEMQRFPRIRADYSSALLSGGIKAAIDQYVHSGAPHLQTIIAELRNRIAVKKSTPEGTIVVWNHTLLHAVVHYLGTTCVTRITNTRGIVEFDPEAKEVELLTELVMALNNEGQYYLLCVVADQLRYPSAHTHFYISFLLHLFPLSVRAEQPNAVAERISRVLLERVLVHKPHPWALCVCFIELLGNPIYAFWEQPFVQAEPDINALFMQAHRSIGHQSGMEQ